MSPAWHRPGGILYPIRGDAIGRGVQIAERCAGVPRATRNRPPGEGRIRPHRACRQKIGDPPGVISFEIDQFDVGVDHFQFERHGHRRALHGRRQPGGEHVFDRAAAAADFHERFATDQPDRPQVGRMKQELHESTIDDDARHRHQGTTLPVPEHHIAVFDAVPPAPGRCATRHPTVDAGENRLQRLVAEVREHDRRRREPDQSADHGEHGQREEAQAPPRTRTPLIAGSGVSRRHSEGV